MSSFSSMQSTVGALCQAIEELAPPIKPRLRAPASQEHILAAQKSLGLAFPEELKYFLMCHNGQEFYTSPGGYGDPLVAMLRQPATGKGYSHYWLAGAQEIVDATVRYRDDQMYFQEARFETFGPARYHDQFIIFTESENADCLVMDMLPEPGGIVGQIVLFSTQPTEIIVLAPDLETFLQSLAADYKDGRVQHSPCEYFVSYVESSSDDTTFDGRL
jgi:cell wall assembly regulator SMI1